MDTKLIIIATVSALAVSAYIYFKGYFTGKSGADKSKLIKAIKVKRAEIIKDQEVGLKDVKKDVAAVADRDLAQETNETMRMLLDENK